MTRTDSHSLQDVSPVTASKLAPWWADAHLFLPFILGPVAFLVRVLPGLPKILEGQPVDLPAMLAGGLVNLVVFSLLGYGLGLFFHWVMAGAAHSGGSNVDITVGDEAEAEIPQVKMQPVEFPLDAQYWEPGLRLAENLEAPEGVQLAPSGTLLSEDLIEKAKQSGIMQAMIEGVKYVQQEEQGPKAEEEVQKEG
jgi:hypothetical protein